MQFRRCLGAWLASAASAGLCALPQAASAQSAPVVSRAVVQSLPSAASQRLNAALARSARDPRDFTALIDAGDAANAMGDPEAAAGFYKRADAISANNPRIKAGLARALVLQGKPAEAIPLFAQAEASGSAVDVTADRGLAFDLVGDTATAQKYYRTAMARKEDDEVRRRLGISLAIAGDAVGSDAMLMPLLRKQDKPGWRSHAFALAIAGKTKEAVDTVNSILPGPLAQSVTPYLRYMPRLTRAQQAAAANLGKFPRASEIGRDDPTIAAYAPTARAATADAGLIPQGKPFGSGRSRSATAQTAEAVPLTRSQRRAKDQAAKLARAEADAAARVAPSDPASAIGRDTSGELPPLGARVALSSSTTPLPTPATSGPAESPLLASRPTGRPLASRIAANQGVIPRPASEVPSATPVLATTVPARTASLTLPTQATTASPPTSSVPVVQQAPAAAPGFDLAQLPASTASAAEMDTTAVPPGALASAPPAATPQPQAAGTPPAPVPLEQIFADLGAPSRTAAPVSGAVDIRAIEPAKPEPEVVKPTSVKLADIEALPGKAKAAEPTKDTKAADIKKAADEKKAADAKKSADAKKVAETKKLADAKKLAAKKALPSHPSRIWVQLGVGRDKAAIAYDWRKFLKEYPGPFKGRQAFVSDMGRTNRILAGPFETQKAADAFVTQLKKADFSRGFVWTSPAGQVVDPLK